MPATFVELHKRSLLSSIDFHLGLENVLKSAVILLIAGATERSVGKHSQPSGILFRTLGPKLHLALS
jgi:hypothetical protein